VKGIGRELVMKEPSPAIERFFGPTYAICATACLLVTVAMLRLVAQSTAGPPDLAGVWGPYRGGRGADPALAPPPAGPIVVKPEYAKPYEARRAAEAAATRRGEPLGTASTLCVPYGMPRMMSVAIYPIEIIPTARQVTIIAEAFSEVRRVYLNETQASIEDVPPGYYGHSVGRWEGATLVIDTVGIKPSVAGYQDLPHSPQMRITERLALVAPDILHDRIVIEDPVVLERPVTYTLAYRRLTDYKMVEFVCDNNREYVDQDGVVRMKLRDR
jgi:hypothetical protein